MGILVRPQSFHQDAPAGSAASFFQIYLRVGRAMRVWTNELYPILSGLSAVYLERTLVLGLSPTENWSALD